MAKYKVLKEFIDKHTKETYEANKQYEFTVKRAEEAERNLGSGFLERVEPPKK